jgi:hypothetical protein
MDNHNQQPILAEYKTDERINPAERISLDFTYCSSEQPAEKCSDMLDVISPIVRYTRYLFLGPYTLENISKL